MSSCVIFIFVIRLVHSADGDCTRSDWPKSCEANFKVGPEKCEPCEPGKYGCNCSQYCSIGTYGLNCYFQCDCLEDQYMYCHTVLGCMNVATTLPMTTQTSTTDAVLISSVHTYTNKQKLEQPYEHYGLKNVAMSLLVSVVTVVFFGAISTIILIRISKRLYKREYRKLLSHWQSSDLTAVDTNVYASYNYTDSLLTSISRRSTPECAMYDHSSEASYNILSLRNMSIRGNGGYDVDTCHSITTPPSEEASRDKNRKKGGSDFDLEPECFLNLYNEKQNETPSIQLYNPEVVQYESVLEKKQQNTTKL